MLKIAANISFMFTEVEFPDRFEAAAKAGFKGVEFLFPYAYDKELLAEKLESNNLTQVLHVLPPGDWDAGDRGITCQPERVGEFQDSVGKAIEYATALGGKQVSCLAGIAPKDVDPDILRETYVSNVKFATQKLEQAGIHLLIEPISTRRFPGFYLCHTAQARSVIEEVCSENLWLLYDIFHMQIMEGDLAETMQANLDIIRHIQIADNPGRHEPGTGEIYYPFLFDLIEKWEYKGWIGCEYEPLTTATEGLGWASNYLG